MRQFKAENIKNIALAGHGGAGKTSLAEALLYLTKTTDRLGKVDDGSTVMDYDPEEIRRGVSVSTSVAPIIYQDIKMNIVDTPGLFDFEGGLYEGLRPVETVLITVSGKSGITVGMEKAYKLANKWNKSKMIFVNKMDNEHADFFKIYSDLKQTFGPSICPVVIPHIEDHKITCYIDIMTKKAYKFDNKGMSTQVDVPEDTMLDELYNGLCEAVAETDEELMNKFFEGEEFTFEEIVLGVYNGVTEGTITPVFCGSSTTLEGISMLLYGMSRLLPNAKDMGSELALDKDGNEVTVECNEDAPLVSYVFKTIADPFIGKLSYVKVVSGKLNASDTPTNVRTGNPERMGKLMFTIGKKQEDTDVIVAGDIGAVTKLSETITGDSLCDSKTLLAVEKREFPTPTMSMALVIKNKGDEGKISGAIQRLIEEDPSISYEQNTETAQQIISGMGDQHLDVVVSKLKSKFGIDVLLEAPKIPYRETIRKTAKVQGRHKKQSGGHGQFGDVWIEFEPCETDDLVFEEKIFGGSVPKNYFPAVEKGLRDSVKKGVLAGYPVVGMKATLLDGSYHPVDSSEMSFKMAASLAYKAGVTAAGPVLLEPIYNYVITVTDDNTGDIMGEVNKRRGRVLGMSSDSDNMQVIEAQVPLVEMTDFTTTLRSVTQGRGHFTGEFFGYEVMPPNLQEKVIDEAKDK